MKKIVIVVLCVALLLCLAPAQALAAPGSTYTDGTFEYTELAGGTLSVTTYLGGGGAVNIPASYDPGTGPMAVTAIAERVFYDNDAITSVTVPASITAVGERAFSHCDSLTGVTLADGLKVLGDHMFSNSAVTSVTLPASIETVHPDTFASCDSLSGVTLTDGLTVLGDRTNQYNGHWEETTRLIKIIYNSQVLEFE